MKCQICLIKINYVYLQKKVMIESLKHFFGICGDGHPSILTIGIIPILFWTRVKFFFNFFILHLKILLKRVQSFLFSR
jgi:hypothetical protein